MTQMDVVPEDEDEGGEYRGDETTPEGEDYLEEASWGFTHRQPRRAVQEYSRSLYPVHGMDVLVSSEYMESESGYERGSEVSEIEEEENIQPRERVLSSLQNPEYDWRTISGIARESGLDEQTVLESLHSLGPEVVRAERTDNQGNHLYTTPEKYRVREPLVNKLLSLFAGRVK